MTFQMKKRLCILLIIILILLAFIPAILFSKKQPQGDYITTEEVQVLTELIGVVLKDQTMAENGITVENSEEGISVALQEDNSGVLEQLNTLVSSWEPDNLTYGQYREWYEIASGAFLSLTEEEENAIYRKYRNSHDFLKEDWYLYFEKLCQNIAPEGEILFRELLVLGDHTNVTDLEGNPIENTHVFTQNGRWEKKLSEEFILMQKKAEYLTYAGAIWGVRNVWEEAVLSNAWIIENTEEELRYFYKNYEVLIIKENLDYSEREQVADLVFMQGILQSVKPKTERITGKVLKISAEEVEIEGKGKFPLAEEIQYYRLFDPLEAVGRSEVRLGYDFTDFVIEDGKVQACLLVKDEQMENIRVLIKNSNFDGYYHEEIVLQSDVDMQLIYGDLVKEIKAGEPFTIDTDSEYFNQSRIYLRPTALTGRTRFSNIERNNNGQGYYGSFELEKREDGIVLINEVLLEEYLYAVVPSEMPGYYPMEALKAQAICARTYAYARMENASLGSWGANLDDSATYQVYNNIKENANTTEAVKATRGKLLHTAGGLAQTYYYSTSCGFGTNAAIWNSEGTNTIPYLQAKEMTVGDPLYTPEMLQEEENFKEYITQAVPSHFESKEGWYRWKYEHSDMEHIMERLRSRLENYPSYVYTSKDGELFDNTPINENSYLVDIQVRKRGAGGTIEELLFITNHEQILVKNELHVRAVLTDGESKVYLQDDNTYACGNLLPSAFFIIDAKGDGEKLTGIELTGGGFGHGVGMSQNGARNLANNGYGAEDILMFYYEDCRVE